MFQCILCLLVMHKSTYELAKVHLHNNRYGQKNFFWHMFKIIHTPDNISAKFPFLIVPIVLTSCECANLCPVVISRCSNEINTFF